MNGLRSTAVAVVLALQAAAAMAYSEKTDAGRARGLARLRSFEFKAQTRDPLEMLSTDPGLEARLRKALESRLTGSGFTKVVSGTPDFMIAFYGIAREKSNAGDLGVHGPPGGN